MLKPLFLLILSAFLSFHEFHVSQTTLYYNSQKESIEITIKVAIEDLEDGLRDKGAKQLRIGTANENEDAEKLIENYFKEHLKVFPNNNLMAFSWVGKEVSKDLHDLFIYFEIVDCNKNGEINTLVLENSIFTEIHSKQSNIVLIDFGQNKQTLTFSKDKKRLNITLHH